MEKYNNELLTPENYEHIAKENNKSIKKNIKFVEIKIDDNKKQELINEISTNSNIISNCLTYLKKCYLKSNKKSLLNNICDKFNKHKHFVETITTNKSQQNLIGKNYCACLVIIIQSCTKSINSICKIKDYLNEEQTENFFCQIENLICIINYATQMFGVCKYRE